MVQNSSEPSDNIRKEDGKLYTHFGQVIAGKEIDVLGTLEKLKAMTASPTAQDTAEIIERFRRLLLPIYMMLTENALAGNDVKDEQFVFSFSGAGASDFTFVAEFRALMGDERKAMEEYNASTR